MEFEMCTPFFQIGFHYVSEIPLFGVVRKLIRRKFHPQLVMQVCGMEFEWITDAQVISCFPRVILYGDGIDSNAFREFIMHNSPSKYYMIKFCRNNFCIKPNVCEKCIGAENILFPRQLPRSFGAVGSKYDLNWFREILDTDIADLMCRQIDGDEEDSLIPKYFAEQKNLNWTDDDYKKLFRIMKTIYGKYPRYAKFRASLLPTAPVL